jgi:hypothetical protein
MSDARLASHPFEIRPSPVTLSVDQRPDELMIDWGNLPHGTTASIYLPAVAAAEVLALATLMYPTHNLAASDAHTLACSVGGITYVPIPRGGKANFAGLFSVQLPAGIHTGQRYEIVVRQITGTTSVRDEAAFFLPRRYIYGAFKLTVPVSTGAALLVPGERLLSLMLWILQNLSASNRWYPVLVRYIEQLEGLVLSWGGDPSKVPATQTGLWPGLQGTEPGGPGTSCTGKIDGIVFDHFGDFDAFILVTQAGEHHRFNSREAAVLRLVQMAWEWRIFVTVVGLAHRPDWPLEIILHGPPPASEK